MKVILKKFLHRVRQFTNTPFYWKPKKLFEIILLKVQTKSSFRFQSILLDRKLQVYSKPLKALR